MNLGWALEFPAPRPSQGQGTFANPAAHPLTALREGKPPGTAWPRGRRVECLAHHSEPCALSWNSELIRGVSQGWSCDVELDLRVDNQAIHSSAGLKVLEKRGL